jgi:predicted DNA-binding protein
MKTPKHPSGKAKAVSISIPPENLERLDEIARRKARTRSAQINVWIAAASMPEEP